MISDKTRRYKLVVKVLIVMSAVITVIIMYIPARAPVPSLTLTCHAGGHRLTWDSCDLCHTQRNNTYLQLQLQVGSLNREREKERELCVCIYACMNACMRACVCVCETVPYLPKLASICILYLNQTVLTTLFVPHLTHITIT